MTWRDIAALFEKMELDLVKSLKRNLGDHKAWEKEEGFDWPAWQAEKLKHIKRYREQNEEIMKEYHNQISEETENMLQEQYAEGYKDESDFFDLIERTEDGTWQLKEADREPDEVLDTEEIKKTPTEDSFFGVNDNRLDKLIEDMQTVETKVESAALRMMDDVYRQTLYRAEMAMAAGATTLPQALDMAVKDFLNAGINCIEYKDGRRVNIDDYAQMALRTAATKAYMQGEAKKRDEMGIDTVLISQYGACSETCLPWQGRVYIDDVWGSAWEKELEKSNRSGTIVSGAVSGARNPFGEEAKEHAQRYYGLVRSMKTDVAKISKVTGIPEKNVQSVKDFIFNEKHDLGGDELEYFEPDYMMAESWQRLIDGKPEKHDITLLHHEIMEKELMSKGMAQDEAHTITSKKYNYTEEAKIYYAEIEKHKSE